MPMPFQMRMLMLEEFIPLDEKAEDQQDGETNRRAVVLVIDDDEQVRRLLARRLGQVFGKVVTAADMAEAAAAARFHRFTHLVCDYNLGNGQLTGVETIAALRKQLHSLEKAVLFTADKYSVPTVPAFVDEVVIKGVHGTEQLIAALERPGNR